VIAPSLLDVNVLIALFDPAHINHDEAHDWFKIARGTAWATCPITINGVVRVLSNPAYPTIEATPAEIISRLQDLCSSPHHEFWPDDLSLLENRNFRSVSIGGHQKITDVYLLALAVNKSGQMVTFDRSIPLKAVVGAEARHLKLLGSTRHPSA
jgi:toxin-antitoxin system PIN domain toxin